MNKSELLTELDAAGVVKVEAEYSGYNDEGFINDVVLTVVGEGGPGLEALAALKEKASDFVYEVLERNGEAGKSTMARRARARST